MLNRILQTLLLCLAVVILTTGIALSSPFPQGVLIAEHTSDHDAAISQPVPSAQPTDSSQANTSSSAQPDRDTKPENIQPTQANPSVPYDPYDYDAIREMNREIYGEAKAEEKE